MLAVTMPQGSLVWPFQWSSLMADSTTPVAMDTDLTSGSSVDNENTTLSQLLLDAAFQEDEETSLAPLNDISSADRLISVPFLNGSMEMNNDLLDLSKPIQMEGLQHGISSMSLDSLNNDSFVDAVEVHIEQDESPLSGLSELNSCPDTDAESVIEQTKEKDQQMPKELESFKQYDENIDNESDGQRQPEGANNMQETVVSDSVKASVVSQSPESYTTLYKAFEIAQEEPIDTEQCDKPKESTLDMLNRTSPKLQRVALRKAKTTPEKKSIIINNPVVIDQKLAKTFSKHSPLKDSSLNLTWKQFEKENSCHSVTTFANILQKKSTPSPKTEKFTKLGTNDSVHWTELMQEKSNSDAENGIVRRIRRTKRISRPKSLPIQLRHIRRPASRHLRTPEDKKSKAYEEFLQLQTNINSFGEDNKSQKDKHRMKDVRGYYEPAYMSHGYHTLPAVLNWYKNHQDMYSDQSQVSFKKRSPMRNRKGDSSGIKRMNSQERDATRNVAVKERDYARTVSVEEVRNEDEFDEWQDLQCQELPPQDITISPRLKKQTRDVDMVVMKGLVTAVGSAVDVILDHFSRTSETGPQHKAALGDTVRTPIIGLLVLDHLCPAIANILKDGMKPYIRNYIIGRAKNSIWQIVEATTELGPGTRSLYELVCLIQEQKSLSTDALKFNAFIFGILSTKCLEVWLNHIRRHPDIVQSYFEKNAFLSQCGTSTNQLFNDLMVAVQPLSLLPFKLALDFELKYTQKQTYRTRQESYTDPQSLMSLPWLGRSNSRPRTLPGKDDEQVASWQSWASPSNILGSLRINKGQSSRTGVESMKVTPEPQKSDASWMRSKELLKTAIIGRDKASLKKRTDKPIVNKTHGLRKNSTEVVQTKRKTFQTQSKTVNQHLISNKTTEGNKKPEEIKSQTGSSQGWSLGWMTGAVSKKLYGEGSHKQDAKYPVIGADKSNSARLQRTNQSEELSESTYPSTSMMDSIGSNVIKAFDYMLLPKESPKEFQMVEMRNTRPLKVREQNKSSTGNESRRQTVPFFEEAGRQAVPPSAPRTQQNLVKTRCHNVSMEKGFLSFSKGDILQLKEQIDRELLLCSNDEETGLVYEAHVKRI